MQSVNAQLVDLRETAVRRGWEIVHEFTDKGISGAKWRDGRPVLDAMLKAATRREFDMAAAWLVDRRQSMQAPVPPKVGSATRW